MYYVLFWQFVLCYGMCYAVLCYVRLCYVMSCYVLFCYVLYVYMYVCMYVCMYVYIYIYIYIYIHVAPGKRPTWINICRTRCVPFLGDLGASWPTRRTMRIC